MDLKAFGAKRSGELVPTIGGADAFVPWPLPPSLDLSEIALTMAEAMQAIGELRGACRRLANPYVLIRPLQRREALTSSAMEGTFTHEDDLILAEAGATKRADEDTTEVYNYIQALRVAIEDLKRLPISHRMLRQAHQTLLQGVGRHRGAHKLPGEYKKDQNMIGGRTLETARYIPPPPQEASACMDALEAYINRPEKYNPSPVMDLALVHYHFEAIHPFADGNGRVGRMLITLMSVADGLLDMPVLYMSPAIEKEKDEYIDLMFNVSAQGEWSAWLNYFFVKLAASCSDTVQIVDRLINLHAEYRSLVAENAKTSNILTLVDMLFEQPVITVRDATERLQVSDRAARNTVQKLVELGVLTEFADIYPRHYLAPRIYRIAQSDH